MSLPQNSVPDEPQVVSDMTSLCLTDVVAILVSQVSYNDQSTHSGHYPASSTTVRIEPFDNKFMLDHQREASTNLSIPSARHGQASRILCLGQRRISHFQPISPPPSRNKIKSKLIQQRNQSLSRSLDIHPAPSAGVGVPCDFICALRTTPVTANPTFDPVIRPTSVMTQRMGAGCVLV